MRELKLKYFIDLGSNIPQKSKADADALNKSQETIQRSFDKTVGSLGRLDSAYARFANNGAAQRQAGYMGMLARSIDQVSLKMRNLAALSAKVLEKAPGAIAGAVGGFYAAKTMLDKPVDYDTRLRGATATAYAGSDVAGLRAGLAKVNALINGTVRSTSGATRDTTLGAYEKLVGSGTFSKEESAALLPTIMKTAVAGRADANDLVQAAEKMKVNLGLRPEQMGVALAKVLRGGQEGGFEIKDSAKWIGPLLPHMKGYKGMAGVEHLVTMLQQSRATAGTNDEAANNLRNFLQKMGADSTAKDFKKQGINLTDEMAAGRMRDENPVQTYMALLDKVMAKQDPQGKARKAMRAADKAKSPEERAAMYEDISKLYQNAGIGKIIADLQEFGGYSALAGTKDYGKKVLASVQGERGDAVNTGYGFMTEGTGARVTNAGNRIDIAMSDALGGKAGYLNTLIDKAVDLADAFPKTTAAATGATAALGIASAAVALFGFAVRANTPGMPKLPGMPGGGPSTPFPTLPGAVATSAAMGAGALGLSVAGGLAVVGAPILGASMLMSNAMNTPEALRARIATRSSRMGEIDEIMAAGGSAASLARLAGERANLGADRDAMAMRLNAGAGAAENWRGRGYNDPRLLMLTSPGKAEQMLPVGQATKLELGEGRIVVDVRLPEGVSAVTSIAQQSSALKLSAGNTNPGSVR